MTEAVKGFRENLSTVLKSVEGLHAIVLTDRDGVIIMKVDDGKAPEHVLRQKFLSTYGTVSDQTGKIGLGENKSLVCFFNSYQIALLNFLPIVVTLIASGTTNTGLLLDLQDTLEPLLQELRTAMNEA